MILSTLVLLTWATLTTAGGSYGTTASAPPPAQCYPSTITKTEKETETYYKTYTSYISVTTTETYYKTYTDYKTVTNYVTNYVTVTGPTTTQIITKTSTQYNTVTNYVTVPGPTTTVTATVPGPTTTRTATVPGPTTTVTATVPGPTTTVTATVPGPTVTSTVAGPGSTVTAPGSTITRTVTSTVAGPGSTVTLPGGTQTVTSTVAGPGSTVTAPGSTITRTVTSTVVGPGSTVTAPGGTQTVTSTVAGPGSTVTLPGGTQTVTSTVAGPGSTVTLPGGTVTLTITSTVAGPSQTITEIDTVPTTFTATVTTFTGLVTCPSRIINPTYTPPTPLPTDYLWGCPPGQLCHPKRENCNFEQNPPADSYVCSPDECLPVTDLPPIETWLNYEDINSTCALLTPIDDYFNLNPTFFGLDFSIFDIYGQPKCSYSPPCPPSTVTVQIPGSPVTIPTTIQLPGSLVTILTTVQVPGPKVTIPTTIQIPGSPVTIPTTIQIPGSPVTIPTTIQIPGSPVTIPTTIQIPGPPVTVITTVTVKEWQAWSSSAPDAKSQSKWGQSSAPPAVTKRAELADRDLQERAPIFVAPQCYAVCDYAAAVYQSIGNAQALCSTSGRWAVAYARVTSCTNKYTATGVRTVAVVLNKPLSWSNAHCRPTKRALFGRAVNWGAEE